MSIVMVPVIVVPVIVATRRVVMTEAMIVARWTATRTATHNSNATAMVRTSSSASAATMMASTMHHCLSLFVKTARLSVNV